MSTSRFVLAVVATAAGLLGAAAGGAAVQQSKAPDAGDEFEMKIPDGLPPEQAAMLEKYIRGARPGAEHAFLAKAAGDWNGTVTVWDQPGAEPATAQCVSTYQVMMGGRFVRCQTSGQIPGMTRFEGFGLFAYDNVARRYESVWADTTSTGIAIGTGTLGPDGTTLTWTMKAYDALSGQEESMRQVERRLGPDTMALEFYVPAPDGKEFKRMQIDYTRASGAPRSSLPQAPEK